MSNSAILSSSIAKKWWMALTGLFLCLFLVGHLIGNLQLIFVTGVEGKRAFNEYAYFMTHNIFIKIMSYATYLSILLHAVDGILLTIKNKKSRPIKYAYNKPGANSSTSSRYMAVLGSAILIFIVMHMSSFWAVMHFDEGLALHTEKTFNPVRDAQTGKIKDTIQDAYYTTSGDYLPVSGVVVKDKTILYRNTELVSNEIRSQIDPTYTEAGENPPLGEAYKDLHSLTLAYFGKDLSSDGFPPNKYALIAVALYVLAMLVLCFHLWHGFSSAFQSLGINHKKYNNLISMFGKSFSVIVPLAFAIIPLLIYYNK